MVNQPSPPPCFTIQGAAFHTPLPWPGAEAPGGPVGPVPSAHREADGDPPLRGTGQRQSGGDPQDISLRQPALRPPAGSQSDPKCSPIAPGKGAQCPPPWSSAMGNHRGCTSLSPPRGTEQTSWLSPALSRLVPLTQLPSNSLLRFRRHHSKVTEGKARKALERRYQPERGGRATPGHPCRYESYTRSLCSPSLCTTSPAHRAPTRCPVLLLTLQELYGRG